MNEEQKKQYREKYLQKKQKGGMKFFPDVLFKDTIFIFGVFVLLIMLATFVGVANEPKADPNDSTYIPRPEWYFLFLFQMLKYFPGQIEWIGTFLIPTIAMLALFLLPFYDRSPFRHFSKRKLALSLMALIVLGMAALTTIAVVTTPVQTEAGAVASTLSEKITAGEELYSINCVDCHGAEGEGGEIKGVEGLEGFKMKPINSQDEMYTRNDATLVDIISFGQPSLGMQPFGKASGGALSVSDIENIVAFMRYTWDDRAEKPAEAKTAAIPTLAPDEVPSYNVHIAPVIKRYCLSCHRPGKKNNNYFMSTYQEVTTSGDHAPNVKPGDLNSNMILMLERQKIEAGNPMPPTKPLPPELVEMFKRWVMGGLPETQEQAAAASPAGGAAPTQAPAAQTPAVQPAAAATPAPSQPPAAAPSATP